MEREKLFWQVIDYTATELSLQLDLAAPELVSRGQWEDEISITFWGYFIFVTARNKAPLEEDYTVRVPIGRQSIPSQAGVDLSLAA